MRSSNHKLREQEKKGTENYKNNQKKINKMATSTYLSIITLNVNGLNAPIKIHRVAKWIKKQDPYICSSQETHFRSKDIHRLKVKRWKKILHTNENKKKAGVAILVSDKIESKTKSLTRDKRGHNIMIKGSNQQEDIMLVNICAPNIGANKANINRLKGRN